LKNCAAAQHTAEAVLAVGLRQKALPQRFLIATTAGKVFPQPVNIGVNPCSSAVKKTEVCSWAFGVQRSALNVRLPPWTLGVQCWMLDVQGRR
jgi:hypothetical protein